MNYTESREQSAEILRAVLGHLGQNDAAFNPVSFALWYEHVAGINPALTQALAPLLQAGTRLNDAMVLQLFRAHVAPADQQAVELASVARQPLANSIQPAAISSTSMPSCATSPAVAETRLGAPRNHRSRSMV